MDNRRFGLGAKWRRETSLPSHRRSGFFHWLSRCVRRAFLCGEDAYSGRSYEHRRAWVEERLLMLAECFAAGLAVRYPPGNVTLPSTAP
jgi:hypothetical protein